MTKDKQLRKSLKGPDQFQKTVASGLNWMQNHQQSLFAVLGVLILIAAAYPAKKYLDRRKATELQKELAKVEMKFEDEEKKAADEREKIQKEITALNAAKPADAKKPNPATEAQQKALEAKIEAVKADHQSSLNEYKTFFAAHPNHAEGWMAGFRAVTILLEQKKYNETPEILEKVVANSKGYGFYQIQGRFTLINVYEELGDYDKALKVADDLLAVSDKEMKPQALLTKGRLEIAKNNKEAANKTFDLLIKDHEGSAEADKARSIKAVLIN